MTRRLYAGDFILRKLTTPNEDCVNCPHCSAILEVGDDRWSEDRTSWEDGAIECPACGQEFMLTVQYIMHVSARIVD